MDLTIQFLITRSADLGLRILGAIIIWLVGTWAIGLIVKIFTKAIDRKDVDHTMAKYFASALGVLLRVILIVSVLGYLGVETTSFAAFLAAIGFAIGAAWGGLLSNLAAGVFLVFLRPFQVGDMVSVTSIIGVVREITLFSTAIDTPDNVRTYVGNNRILCDTIQNFSTNPYRRVELLAQLHGAADHNAAMSLLKERLKKIPNVVAEPEPCVEILQFTEYGPLLAVRPFCANAHYWQVYFDTNRLIRDAFGEAKLPTPEKAVTVRMLPQS